MCDKPEYLVFRDSVGVNVSTGAPNVRSVDAFPDKGKEINCRTMKFNADGGLFAWTTDETVNIADTATWKLKHQFAAPKTHHLSFSPKSTFLATWTPFFTTPSNPQGNRNLKIWKLETGEEYVSYVLKKQSQWEPQWSRNENLMARQINRDLNLYENLDFKNPAHKMDYMKVENFSLAAGSQPYHVLLHVPGAQGQPAFVRLFEYPNIRGAPIANLTLFKGESVDMKWNKRGTAVLVLASTETDKEGETYYGQTYLHLMDVTGNTVNIQLGRETGGKGGPIYSVEWSPSSKEFCVVYGFMPARASIFNVKCDRIHDFGEGRRNVVYYNAFGNMMILAGFGNLRGNVEVWNVATQTPKLVSQYEAPDSTDLKWDPTGEWIMTCTTAPRLRIANGVKVWHCTGKLVYQMEQPSPSLLYEVQWRPIPSNLLKPKEVTPLPRSQVQEIKQPKAASAYVPPHMRNAAAATPEEPTKNQLRNKRKKEAKKAAKEAKKNEQGDEAQAAEESKQSQTASALPPLQLTGDPEKDKKIKNIRKKLNDIQKMKAQQREGKKMDGQQMQKIGSEKALLEEMKQLTL